MNQPDFLRVVVAKLEQAQIPFMVSGSVASGYHGLPRSTLNNDVIIDANRGQIDQLILGLGDRCYVSRDAAHEAIERRGMFNVIDIESGVKVDLMVRKDRPFSITELHRRQPATIGGVELHVATAEDCMLSKLEWSKLGESTRQYEDALKVATVRGLETLDLPYLEKWAAELGVDELLDKLLRDATGD